MGESWAKSRAWGLIADWQSFRSACGEDLRVRNPDRRDLTSIRAQIQKGLDRAPVQLPHPWPEGGDGERGYIIFVSVTGVDRKNGNREVPGRTRFEYWPVLPEERRSRRVKEGSRDGGT